MRTITGTRVRRLAGLLLLLAFPAAPARSSERPAVGFEREGERLRITVGGEPAASYVFRDETILRPYFAHVYAPGRISVTRSLPPVEGTDPTDHATMHPGIWLAFGDINGVDFWRNKGRIEHERFLGEPRGEPGRGAFSVSNRYVARPGEPPVCTETCRVTILARPAGTLLILDSEFSSPAHDLAFGSQEEMGLGVRVATPLAVKQGGRLLSSEGQSGERSIWGKPAAWCDASGTIGATHVGVTLMTDPATFGKGWFHVRDYGLMVANPIERSLRKQGEPAKLVVARGQTLRLRFGVLLHARPAAEDLDLAAAYRDFLRELSSTGGPRLP
jgi:hypothetical protein